MCSYLGIKGQKHILKLTWDFTFLGFIFDLGSNNQKEWGMEFDTLRADDDNGQLHEEAEELMTMRNFNWVCFVWL